MALRIQIDLNVISANYTNSTAGIAHTTLLLQLSDSYDSVEKSWNWTVTSQSVYNVSGYVFDNYGSGLEGVLVQNGSNQNTTMASGDYLVAGLVNGTYNFSYSKEWIQHRLSGRLQLTVQIIQSRIRHYTIPPHLPRYLILQC